MWPSSAGYHTVVTYPSACKRCSSTDVRYQYDRHEPTLVEIGTGQKVEMPAAGQQGVLQVACATCGESSIHHVGWFDPPTDGDQWTVRTIPAANVGDPDPTSGGFQTSADRQDSPRYNDRDPV